MKREVFDVFSVVTRDEGGGQLPVETRYTTCAPRVISKIKKILPWLCVKIRKIQIFLPLKRVKLEIFEWVIA